MSFFENSVFFGIVLSILAYITGTALQKRFKLAIFNPLLISVIIVIFILAVTNISYDVYYKSAEYLSFLLTPATVCLAIPLYEQLDLLKGNMSAIIMGVAGGVLTSLVSILLMSIIFGLDHTEFVTLIPKSITTAIGIGISEELGGYVTLTVAVIIATGILGNMIAEGVCKLFRITHPIAKGVAIGSSAHAIGTARAMEMGEIEGAISSLSIALSGLITVAAASLFAQFH